MLGVEGYVSDCKFGDKPMFLWLSRRRFRKFGTQTWYGNWCWTGVSMSSSEAANLLNYLSLDDRWHCEGGWCDLTDAFTEGKVTPEMLNEIQ